MQPVHRSALEAMGSHAQETVEDIQPQQVQSSNIKKKRQHLLGQQHSEDSDKEDADLPAAVSLGPKQNRAKRPIVFVEYGRSLTNTGSQKLVTDSKRQREVRVHAAMASAETRKATIAKREALRQQQRPQGYSALRMLTSEIKAKHMTSPVRSHEQQEAAILAVDRYRFHQLVDFVTDPQADGVWYLGPVERTSLAHKAMRSNLFHAMINSSTLYQAALFVAGTFSNTCGLPSSAIHMGTGLILLRGASLKSIQSAVTAPSADALTPVAIAMLAGWERRFGDQESYQVHMLAWRSLLLSSRALEDGHVATLTNLTLEALRANLDERAMRPFNAVQQGYLDTSSHNARSRMVVPTGFSVIHLGRPEARSLLSMISEASAFDPRSPDSVPKVRALGVENIAWSANHSISCEPVQSYEDAWDVEELNALYHIRAATICIFGILIHAAMQHHRIEWTMDLKTAFDVHVVSCQHLRTQALMGTRFEELAFWSRFILCTVSRDPPRDALIISMLDRLKIHTWEDVHFLLSRYIPLEQYIGQQCRSFFYLLDAQREKACSQPIMDQT